MGVGPHETFIYLGIVPDIIVVLFLARTTLCTIMLSSWEWLRNAFALINLHLTH